MNLRLYWSFPVSCERNDVHLHNPDLGPWLDSKAQRQGVLWYGTTSTVMAWHTVLIYCVLAVPAKTMVLGGVRVERGRPLRQAGTGRAVCVFASASAQGVHFQFYSAWWIPRCLGGAEGLRPSVFSYFTGIPLPWWVQLVGTRCYMHAELQKGQSAKDEGQNATATPSCRRGSLQGMRVCIQRQLRAAEGAVCKRRGSECSGSSESLALADR